MRGSMGSSSLLMINALSKVALLTYVLAFSRGTGSKPTTIMAPGGRIDVFVSGEGGAVTQEDLIGWVSAASKSVSTYFGRYPVPHVEVRITTTEGTVAEPLVRQLESPFQSAATRPWLIS